MNSKKTNKKSYAKSLQSKKGKINPIVAGAAGAAVGVGIGVVTSAILNDEKAKKKIGKAVNIVKEQAQEYMETVKDSDVLEKGRKAAKETMTSATKAVQDKANEQMKSIKNKANQKVITKISAHR